MNDGNSKVDYARATGCAKAAFAVIGIILKCHVDNPDRALAEIEKCLDEFMPGFKELAGD